jgi:hypothetical protein
MIRDIYKSFWRKATKLKNHQTNIKTRKLVNNKNRKVVPPNALLSGDKLLAKIARNEASQLFSVRLNNLLSAG